jgi:hypothetical protein
MENVEIYKCAKFQFQIPYIRGCTKKIKSDRFWRFESYLEWLTILGTVHPLRSDGIKIDGTKLMEPNAARNVGPEPNYWFTLFDKSVFSG